MSIIKLGDMVYVISISKDRQEIKKAFVSNIFFFNNNDKEFVKSYETDQGVFPEFLTFKNKFDALKKLKDLWLDGKVNYEKCYNY